MAKTATRATEPAMTITELKTKTVSIALVGLKPLIFNRMAEKGKRELLLGGGRKTAAERAQNLKHNPPEEFRNSIYRNPNREQMPATRLRFPASAFKGAMMTAALEIPGVKKAEVGRLVWVESDYVDIYGIPWLKMDVVRSADINKTPDIRTRATVREWACTVTITYAGDKLNDTSILNLVTAAGLISGVGDNRQEKGKNNFGQFEFRGADDKEFNEIRQSGGLDAQDRALENYECYDEETIELLDFFNAEVLRRGRGAKGDSPMFRVHQPNGQEEASASAD